LTLYAADGVTQLDQVTSSTRTINNAWRRMTLGLNLGSEGNTAGDVFFDDVAVNDTSGSDDTGYPDPEARVLHLPWSGDGSGDTRGSQGTDWETGPSASGAAFAQVDEAPADDATSYIALLATSTGIADAPSFLFAHTTATSLGIDSNDEIHHVRTWLRHAATTTGTREHYALMKSGATVSEASVTSVSSASWTTTLRTPQYVDPNTSAAWTLAAVDALQTGFRAGADVTPNPWITLGGAFLEYVDAAGGGGGGGGKLGLLTGRLRGLVGGRLVR
jgi:hypothetical protein